MHMESLAVETKTFSDRDKVGIKQLFFIYTFRISNWLVTGIKFWSDQDGKIHAIPSIENYNSMYIS